MTFREAAEQQRKEDAAIMRCLGEYDEPGSTCGWAGSLTECILMNGMPICPKCGSSTEEVIIPDLKPVATEVRLPANS